MSSRCVLTEKEGAERDKGRGKKEGGEEGEDNTTPTHSHSLTGCNIPPTLCSHYTKHRTDSSLCTA